MATTTKGFTQYANTDVMNGPAQINAAEQFVENLVDATVSTASQLPASGNWPGRQMRALDTGRLWVWYPGTLWTIALGSIVQLAGGVADNTSGTPVSASQSVTSSAQSISVPNGVTARVHLHTSFYTYISAAASYAGYAHTYIDGTLDYGVAYAVRYHNHGRAGGLVFVADWDFGIVGGNHTLGVQLLSDSGISPYEVWDFQTSYSVSW